MPSRAVEAALRAPVSELKAELFKTLGHPARLRVLELLSDGEHSVSDMQPHVGIESSHLSQQLGILRRAGLVHTRKQGASVIYALADPLVAELLAVAKRLLITSLAQQQDLLADLQTAAST
ncbi:MAG: ArsR/SmtB family transcription factor [Acidimicrobiales bacterium]